VSRQPDAISRKLIAKFAGVPGISIEDIMRLQARWAPLFKAATKPAAMVGQKYI
jgi:hypothetical protein